MQLSPLSALLRSALHFSDKSLKKGIDKPVLCGYNN